MHKKLLMQEASAEELKAQMAGLEKGHAEAKQQSREHALQMPSNPKY